MINFIRVTTSEGYDAIVNTDTIKYIERNPNDKENSIWVWTDWANNGYLTVNENIDAFNERLEK